MDVGVSVTSYAGMIFRFALAIKAAGDFQHLAANTMHSLKLGIEFEFVYGMQTKKAKNKPIDVYWFLPSADIPPRLEFVEDMNQPSKGHYFLAVTVKEGMSVETLAGRLERVANRMNIIKNGGSLM